MTIQGKIAELLTAYPPVFLEKLKKELQQATDPKEKELLYYRVDMIVRDSFRCLNSLKLFEYLDVEVGAGVDFETARQIFEKLTQRPDPQNKEWQGIKKVLTSLFELPSRSTEQKAPSTALENPLKDESRWEKVDARTTGERGHPNSDGKLMKAIKEILDDVADPISLKKLHKLVYKKLGLEYPHYVYEYKTHAKNYCENLLLLLVIRNEPALILSILEKCTFDLSAIVDAQGNNTCHLAAFFGLEKVLGSLISFSRDKPYFKALINGRNEEGTNPLGMVFLNHKINLKIASQFILEPFFKINRYLNNFKGQDVFAPHKLRSIGGMTCLHVALKGGNRDLLKLLQKREDVNFKYPAMNPDFHMWNPSKLAEAQLSDEYEEILGALDESDSSGDSDDEKTSAGDYKRGLKRFADFLDEEDESPVKLNERLLNSPKDTPLTPKQREETQENARKIAIAHFHGVPLMAGQLTDKERRDVGRTMIDINIEYLDNKFKNSSRNLKLKSIYSRTTTTSHGIENHKMLVTASEEKLRQMTATNHLLRHLWSQFWSDLHFLEEIKATDGHYIKKLTEKYGLADHPGIKKFEELFRAIKSWQEHPFFFVINKYINNFPDDDLMPFFWKILELVTGPIPGSIAKYRFSTVSVAKTPDHSINYGFGYNVETAKRGEVAIQPGYVEGRPHHRLAGFLYVVLTDLATYKEMGEQLQFLDAVQHNKASKLKVSPLIAHQSEVVFLGGVDGEHVALIIPLVYLNFGREKNRELYEKVFNLTEQDWEIGKSLKGSFKQRKGEDGKESAQTKEFQLLLKIYIPLAIKLAEKVANKQGKALRWLDSNNLLTPYSDQISEEKKETHQSEVQSSLKKQTYGKYAEGKKKLDAIPERSFNRRSLKFIPINLSQEIPKPIDLLSQRSLGATGIENRGNDCFFNAPLQLLFQRRELWSLLLDEAQLEQEDPPEFFPFLTELALNYFKGSQQQTSVQYESSVMRPLLGFSDEGHEDAAEVLDKIFGFYNLENFHSTFTRKRKVNLEKRVRVNGEMVADYPEAGPDGHLPRIRETHFMLKVPLAEQRGSFQDWVTRLFERQEGSDPVKFSKNGKVYQSSCSELLQISELRASLFLQINRFTEESYSSALPLKSMVLKIGANSYAIEGFIVYIRGKRRNLDHYISYCKSEEDWICFDDDKVPTHLSNSAILEEAKKAYIFYLHQTT